MNEILKRLLLILKNDPVLSMYYKQYSNPQSIEVLGENIQIREIGEIVDLITTGKLPFLMLGRLGVTSSYLGKNRDELTFENNIQINFLTKGFKTTQELLMGNIDDIGLFDITDVILSVIFKNPYLEISGNKTKYTLNPSYNITEIDLIAGYNKNYFVGGRSLNISYYNKEIVKHFKNNTGY